MKIYEKLKIIKGITGFTQGKIAQEVGVSFATVNSWINERSLPHKRHQKKINNLFYKHTGIKKTDQDSLTVKNRFLRDRIKQYRDIISLIKNNSDLYDEFVLSLTYNSNSIEGSTLTKEEIADILFENLTLSNKDLKEHFEAKNHQLALKYLFEQISYRFKISESFILKLHEILMRGILEDAGQYRNHAIRIVGVNIPTTNFLKVPLLMKQLIKGANKKSKNVIKHIAEVHSRFEKIHPFSDGNGRIGRILIQTMLLREKYPPAVIEQKKKRFYYKYLNLSQRQLEFEPLEEFICDSILVGLRIITQRN